MHRSTSTAKVSDEEVRSSQSAGASSTGNLCLSFDGTPNAGLIDPSSSSSHATKRDRSRLRSAENAVHLIPLVLLLCALVLWIFSTPVDLIRRNSSVVPGIEKLKDGSAFDVEGTHNNSLSR